METHIEGIIFGYSYGGYNVRRLILRLQFMVIHRGGKMYGDSYRAYNVWRIM